MSRFISILLMGIWMPLIAASELSGVEASPAKSTVLRLLEGYEWQLSRESFDQLGSRTYLTLIDIVQDDALMAYTQGRAIAALTLYSNETVWQFFLTTISDETQVTKKRRALEGICEVFLDSRSDQLKISLLPHLSSRDVHFRTKVARCLGKANALNRDDEVTAALLTYRDSITESWEKRAAGFEE